MGKNQMKPEAMKNLFEPKYSIGDVVEVTFHGTVEGYPVTVEKELTVIGLKLEFKNQKLLVSDWFYDLTEELGQNVHTVKECRIKRKVRCQILLRKN